MNSSYSKTPKALALFSGGMDSAVMIKLVQAQGVEVVALHFLNPFDKPKESIALAKKRTKMLGVPLRVIEKDERFLDVIRYPEHGFGSALNPCIDCRIHLLKTAKRLLEEENADFLITGEVVGQRPMSQKRKQMDIIERKAGVEGLLLRPLSAKLLPATMAEKKGYIKREAMEAIEGRSRKRQMELAERFQIRDIPTGAGGCLLTDKIYAKKLQDLYNHKDELSKIDYRLLAMGRHFRLDSETKIILTRTQAEGEAIRELLQPGAVLYEPKNFNGPSVMLDGIADLRNERRLIMIASAYIKAKASDAYPNLQLLKIPSNQKKSTLHFIHEKVMQSTIDRYRIVE